MRRLSFLIGAQLYIDREVGRAEAQGAGSSSFIAPHLSTSGEPAGHGRARRWQRLTFAGVAYDGPTGGTWERDGMASFRHCTTTMS